MVCFHLLQPIHCNRLHRLNGKEWNVARNFAYPTITVVHFIDQNWISKILYCIRYVMLCKMFFFPNSWRICRKLANAKIALLHASILVTSFHIKLLRTGADTHNGILMSLLLLVAETIIPVSFFRVYSKLIS